MSEQLFGGEHHSGRPARSVRDAMLRGLLGRCPRCGEGRLFRAFLKSVDRCSVCGEDIHHHRADDLPAYLVVVLVGHVVVGTFMAVEAVTTWPAWMYLAIWVPLTIAMSLALIQPIKGAVIGVQWALYMHGFGGEHDTLETHPEL